MTDINPKRGEMLLNIGEEKVKTRMTLDTCMRIETVMNQSIVKIAQRLTNGEVMLNELISILTPAIRAGGNDMTEKQVGEIVWKAGLPETIKSVGNLLAQSLMKENEGNEQTPIK